MEKRVAVRLPFHGYVDVFNVSTNQNVCHNAKLRNISQTGFSIFSEIPLNKNQSYRFVINAQGIKLDLAGKVVHMFNDLGYSACGIKLSGFSFLNRCRINRLIATKSPKLQSTFFIYSLLGGSMALGVEQVIFGGGSFAAILSFVVTTSFLHFFPPY